MDTLNSKKFLKLVYLFLDCIQNIQKPIDFSMMCFLTLFEALYQQIFNISIDYRVKIKHRLFNNRIFFKFSCSGIFF